METQEFRLIMFEIIDLLKEINEKLEVHSPQPEVIACQGEGESADLGLPKSGYSESGKSEEYPSVDTQSKVNPSDVQRAEDIHEEIKKELDEDYPFIEKEYREEVGNEHGK